MTRRLLVVLFALLPLYAWHLDRPGFGDTEGMFAEPAREMVVLHDWLVPRMNGEPFLTKPPVMYWLPALVFAARGPTEYARIWPVLAALATVAVTGLLGATLFGERTGLLAAVLLGTSLGFCKEARFLRADMVLVFCTTLAFYCYARLRRGAGRGTAVVFWLALAAGVLDKGLLPVVLVGLVIAATEIADGTLRLRTLGARLSALRVWMGLYLLVLVTGPWHLGVGRQVPGFLWDYFVNQHLLFFFDEKLPRDSIPDTLGFFWTMFLVRTLPWSLFLPAALAHAYRSPRDPLQHPSALPFVTSWLLVVLLFFSLASSRLEHYSLPALPAAALLLGSLFAGPARVPRAWLVVPPAIVGVLALAISFRDPAGVLAALAPELGEYRLADLLRGTTVTLAVGLLAMSVLLARGRQLGGVVVTALTAGVLMIYIQAAHERVEPLVSWRPFARTITETASPGTRIFFRASDEYQLCGGLEYYSGQRLDLIPPRGWVPPTFLVGRTTALFTTPDALAQAWSRGDAFFVSDDVDPTDDLASLVPGPFTLLARADSRVLLHPQERGLGGTPRPLDRAPLNTPP